MLEAQICSDVKDGNITRNTINGISKLLNAMFNVKNNKFVIQFDDTNQCDKWMDQNTIMFPKDCYYMIGDKSDSLVIFNYFFRVPESIYHLLLYIGEGKCYYEDGEWRTIYKDCASSVHNWILDTIKRIQEINFSHNIKSN